jgi:hypothetical protein
MTFGIARCASVVVRIVPHAGNGAILRAALVDAARAHEGHPTTPGRWEILVDRASWMDTAAAPEPVSIDAVALIVPAITAPAQLQLRPTGGPWRAPFNVETSATMVRQLLE